MLSFRCTWLNCGDASYIQNNQQGTKLSWYQISFCPFPVLYELIYHSKVTDCGLTVGILFPVGPGYSDFSRSDTPFSAVV